MLADSLTAFGRPIPLWAVAPYRMLETVAKDTSVTAIRVFRQPSRPIFRRMTTVHYDYRPKRLRKWAVAGSEAVLPAYLVGLVLAPTFLRDRELPNRMRIVAFTILTPFYFLKPGSLD